MSSSFQQSRLAEQLRLSKQQQGLKDVATDNDNLTSQQAEPTTAADAASAVVAAGSDHVAITSSVLSSSLVASEEEQDILASESDLLGPGVMPFAPMMQEKRVKVTIRYSAEAGLRPFYLTVVNRIKSAHPDALVEKRILPKLGADAGGNEAIFEVVVDGKTVIGKKKTKMLKVSPLASSRNDESEGNAKSGSEEPNKAGGRSIFVSMEKIDEEMAKARKRRRPSTMYKSKENALRGELATTGAGGMLEGSQQENAGGNAVQSAEIAEAVMRLERLKAMSTASGRA